MGWRVVNIVAPLVIIQSGQPNTGLFIYNGQPANGNPPVLWAVAPGVTKDPFGNTVAAVLGAGNPGGSRLQVDRSGNLSLSDATPVTRLYETPGNGAIVCYDPTGQALGHQLVSVAANAFTDPAGNTIQRGVTAYGLSNPATQYAQLVGANLSFFDTTNDATSAAIIGLTTVTSSDDALALQSPLSAASDIQSSVFIQRAATPGPAHVIVANADLNVRTNTSPAQPATGFSLFSDANGFPSMKPSFSGDTTTYQVGQATFRNTANQTGVSGVVTGLSANLGAGLYRFSGVLSVTNPSAGTDTPEMGFSGTGGLTAANLRASIEWFDSASPAAFHASGQVTALGSQIGSGSTIAAGASAYAKFDGIVNVSAAGTFNIIAGLVAGTSLTALAFSYVTYWPVN